MRYTILEATKEFGATALKGVPPDTLKKRLYRERNKPKAKRKYPHAELCECGHTWFLDERDLKI